MRLESISNAVKKAFSTFQTSFLSIDSIAHFYGKTSWLHEKLLLIVFYL